MENEKHQLARLVEKYQHGDRSAFTEIYNLVFNKAYFTALKICKNEEDAKDITQEAFIYFLLKADEIRNPEAFMSWFNTVVASKAKDMLRKSNSAIFSSEEEGIILDSIPDEDYHPAEDVEQSELQREVLELIDNLNDEKRTAVILFYYNEMTTREIAELLGVNENTIKSRLVQAKKDFIKEIDGFKKKNNKN